MAEGAVWPMIVVVLLERFESCHRMLSIGNEDVVEEFPADGAAVAEDDHGEVVALCGADLSSHRPLV